MYKPLLSLNHDTATLQSGPVSLKVNTQHGARITSFAYETQELLTQPDEHAENFGSTLWDAPQSRWHWPPPAVLDSSPYTARITPHQLEFTSAADQASGLQFSKFIRPMRDAAGVEIEYQITNVGSRPITTAAWEVTRVPGGLTFCPAMELARSCESTLPGIQFVDRHAWYTIDPAPLSIGKKAFFDVREGWLAHVLPSRVLYLKSFPPLNPVRYSTGHTAVEIYAHIDGAYVELENHGPRTYLEPGTSLSHVVHWFVRTVPEHIELRAGHQQLVEFAHALIDTKKS